MDGDSILALGGIPASIAALMLITWILFMCLKIKSTKKNQELLGTVGTVKVLDPAQHQNQLNTSNHEETSNRFPTQHTVNISADYSASSSGALNVSDISAGRSSNDVRTPSKVLQGGITNSIASERKLPDIPLGNHVPQNLFPQDDGSVASDTYATVGYATAGEINATRLAQHGLESGNPMGPSYVPDPTELVSDSDGGETEADGSGSGIVGAVGGAQGGSTSKIHHPYAKVKKRLKDHPYATVKKPTAPLPPTDPVSNVNFHPSGPSQSINGHNGASIGAGIPSPSPGSSRAPGNTIESIPDNPGSRGLTDHGANTEAGPGQQQQFFSGDSQDSSKGYTSISVREPLRHIQHTFNTTSNDILSHRLGNGAHGYGMGMNRNHADNVSDQLGGANSNTYAAVSEASDDMYAAILEEPSYIPTGTSQSNSDTYAVINLPDDDEDSGGGSQTYQKLNNNRDSFKSSRPPEAVNTRGGPSGRDSPDIPPIHHYSKIDKSKKRRPPPPPANQQRHSFNVDQLYAKVQKNGNNDPISSENYQANTVGNSQKPLPDLLPIKSTDMRHKQPQIDNTGRPRVRSVFLSDESTVSQPELTRPPPPPPHPPMMNLRTSPYGKREVNYSDYEVSHYDLNSSSGSITTQGLDHHSKTGKHTEAPSPRLPLPLPSKARGAMNTSFDRVHTFHDSRYHQSPMSSSGAASHPYPLHPHQGKDNGISRQPQSIALDLQIPYADEDETDKDGYNKDGNGYETVQERYPNPPSFKSHHTHDSTKEGNEISSSVDYERIPEPPSGIKISMDKNMPFGHNTRQLKENKNNDNNNESAKERQAMNFAYSTSKHGQAPGPRVVEPFPALAPTVNTRSSTSIQNLSNNSSNSDQVYNKKLSEPPYAKLVNERESEDEEEEGYETIPPSNMNSHTSNAPHSSFSTHNDITYHTKQSNVNVFGGPNTPSEVLRGNASNEYDPGYEIVPSNKNNSSDAGYETVADKTKGIDSHANDNYNIIHDGMAKNSEKYDYGYETVRDSNTSTRLSSSDQMPNKYMSSEGDPGYETLVNPNPSFDLQEPTRNINARHTTQHDTPHTNFSTVHEITDPGYETVPMYSQPLDFVPKETTNNNNIIKTLVSESENGKIQWTYRGGEQISNLPLSSNRGQQMNVSTGSYQHNMSQHSQDPLQSSPKIHMSVREMNSASSASSVGSVQSSLASTTQPERRNSSVITIQHVDRVNIAPEGVLGNVKPNVKLKHGEHSQTQDSNSKQRHHPPTHHNLIQQSQEYVENDRRHHLPVNVSVGSSEYNNATSSEQMEKDKSNELVSAHIFV